jgi:hypothetical protein
MFLPPGAPHLHGTALPPQLTPQARRANIWYRFSICGHYFDGPEQGLYNRWIGTRRATSVLRSLCIKWNAVGGKGQVDLLAKHTQNLGGREGEGLRARGSWQQVIPFHGISVIELWGHPLVLRVFSTLWSMVLVPQSAKPWSVVCCIRNCGSRCWGTIISDSYWPFLIKS